MDRCWLFFLFMIGTVSIQVSGGECQSRLDVDYSFGINEEPFLKFENDFGCREDESESSTRLWESENFEVSQVSEHKDEESLEGKNKNQTHLDVEPTSIVNGCVNVISGLYMDSELDFVIPGADPLYIQRNYVSADTYKKGPFGKSWSRNYFGIIKRFRVKKAENKYRAWIMESGGACHLYGGQEKNKFHMLYQSYENTVTNSGSGSICGRTNTLNNALAHLPDNTRILTKCSGEQLTFSPHRTHYFWRLTHEKKPNGNQLCYSYGGSSKLDSVKALNSTGKALGELNFQYSRKDHHDYISIYHNEKKKVEYELSRIRGTLTEDEGSGYYINSVTHENGNVTRYYYEDIEDKARLPRLILKSKPNHRFQRIEYYRRILNWAGNVPVKVKKSGDHIIGKVRLLKAPVGTDEKSVITHRFFYPERFPEKTRSAIVLDALNHQTEYKWNSNQRLKQIIHYRGRENYIPYSSDRLFWGKGHSAKITQLAARTFEDANGDIQFMRAFQYDEAGNVLVDELFGNLSGKNKFSCAISQEGKIEKTGVECYTKTFTYSDDGLFLVTSMQEGSVIQTFAYKPGTDLLIAKFTSDSGKIVKREFYTYDDSAVVIQEMEDDGESRDPNDLQGVTQRRIRCTTVRDEFPAGFPEVVKELYLDLESGEKVLSKKMVYHYCQDGRLIAQDLYDARDQYLCSLTWEYDLSGNIIKETNSLGQVTTRRYDASGNKIFEQGPDSAIHKEFTYDYSNRLIRVEDVSQDGSKLTELYKYNYLSQKIASVDIYGNETRYEYDEFGHLIKTILPLVMAENGELVSSEESKTYNFFNTPSCCIDFNGNMTQIESNIRGKPTYILFADGSIEEMQYNLDGTLRKTQHRNGSKSKYCYDWDKRLVQKKTYNRQGKVLESIDYSYNTFHLLSETDTAGNVKAYRYDYAGHLVELMNGESRTTYAYDDVGRVYKTVEYDGNGDNISHIQVFDLLDRVLEERQEDKSGNCLTRVSYEYDVAGNRAAVVNHSEKGEARTLTTYDNRRQPIKIVDPMGNTTYIVYSYEYWNELRQIVPYRQTTDPMGNITENIHDAQGRLVEVVQRNSLGTILHRKGYHYDLNGNKCRQEDFLTAAPGVYSQRIVTAWTYDCLNRVTGIFEAFETPNQKYVETCYNEFGEKSSTIKADGISLLYKYDSLGRLKKYSASDRSFEYKYHYDKNGNLLSVKDCLHDRMTERAYDVCDRLVREILGNGLAIEYTYDKLNRPRVITFPDKSGMEYVYKANRLFEVHRLSQDKQRKYSHCYFAYDLEDKLLSAKLIGKAGEVKYEYDLAGRLKELNHDAWSEFILDYDPVGNIVKREIKDPLEKLSCQYRYDDLYQVIEEQEKDVVTHSYECDSLYNRTSKDGNILKLNGLNQLLDDTKIKYTYDPNGNLKRKISSRGNVYYNYDALDRLTSVISEDKKVSYTYDEQNRRLSKRIRVKNKNGEWKTRVFKNFLYMGQNEVGSYNSRGKPLELRLLGLSKGAEISAAIALELKEHLYAPLHDHIGNVTTLVDAESGKVVEFYRYTAFGEESIFDENGRSIGRSLNPWRYSSKRVDSETGFVHFGRRYYDPPTGRWISPDPIGRVGGPNCYAYVLNRPLTHFDLYGLYEVGDSSFARFGNSFIRGVETACYYVGAAIDFIGCHLVPIPIVRDVLQIIGLTISGQGLDSFHMTFMGGAIRGHLGLPESRIANRFVEIGGICSTKEGMRGYAEKLSERLGGCNVHYYAASSDGLILDLAKAFLRGFGSFPEDAAYTDLICNMRDQLGGLNGGGVIRTFAHSQGALLTHNLTYQISNTCKMMDVYAFGSARFLDSDKFFSAKNYISERDIVPLAASPFHYTRALIQPREDVFFLKSRGTPLFDHMFEGNTYKNVLENLIRNCFYID